MGKSMAHQMGLLLLGLLVCTALAADRDTESGLESGEGIDTTEETATPSIIIFWDKAPKDTKDFFTRFDIPLEWVHDFEGDYGRPTHTVYTADNTHAANRFLTAIIRILESEDDSYDSYGPFSDEDAIEAILKYVEMVHGESIGELLAATPASIPQECRLRPGQTTVANACPQDGLYGLNLIRAPAVWNTFPGTVNQNPTVRVMVADSGVWPTHADLARNLVPGLSANFRNGVPGRLPPTDTDTRPFPGGLQTNHGTHVCGTVFAAHDNGDTSAVGVVGNALGISCGSDLTESSVARCVALARTTRARVINMSFQTGEQYTAALEANNVMRAEFARFCDAGGLIIIAAGNSGIQVVRTVADGSRRFTYPQAFAADFSTTRPRCIINVASVDANSRLSRFNNVQSSNFGPLVRVAAPGSDIKSSNGQTTGTIELSGTSMAAPHVTGMATFLFNEFPTATAERVWNCIVSTATRPVLPNPDLSPNRPINGGIVDLQAAYNCMLTTVTCPITGLPTCVDANSGQAVATCDSTRFFCRQVDRQTCQYNRLPDNTLCDVATPTAASLAQLLEEVSAAELAALGFDLHDDADETVVAIQQTGNKAAARQAARARKNARKNANRNGKLRNCGLCRAGTCVAQTGKVCRTARPRPAQ